MEPLGYLGFVRHTSETLDMKISALVTITVVMIIAGELAMAQGTGQTIQGASRYSIDGSGGGVATTRPQATQPVPPATSVYPYANRSRTAPQVGRQTNAPLTTR